MIESGERKMIHSVFELGDTIAREVMVPRTDVVYIERHKNLRQTMSLFLRSGFSRVPVIGENLDDIVGFAYLKDIVRRDFEAARRGVHPAHRRGDAAGATSCPTPSRSTRCSREMQARRQHIAVVVDEYGGTAGLVTIEDMLEEIVGEITDEYDAERGRGRDARRRLGPGLLALPDRRPRRAVRLRRRGRRRRQRRRPDGQAPRPGADPRLAASRRTGCGSRPRSATGRRNKIGTVLDQPGSSRSRAPTTPGSPPSLKRRHVR